MPELNFKITGDDSELKKTLANIAKVAKENGDKISKEVLKSTDVEIKAREKAVKVTQDQKKASDDIVRGAQAEAAAQDKVAEAVKKKNAAFDATGRQIRPIQMSNSQDEINAANSGKVGTISSGPVVGSSMNWNKLANEAASYGQAARDAHNAAITGASASVKSNEDIRKAIRSLKIEAQSYKNIAESTKDSERLAEYNKKLAETQAEIARLRNVGRVGFDELGNKLTVTAGKQEILTRKLQLYNDALTRAKAPQSFVNLNRKIEDTEIQLGRLKNAGKIGFDEMGNAVAKSTSKLNGLWQGLKTVANILPGVGVAGLLAFAVEPILKYIATLDIFGKKVSESIIKRLMLNDALLKGGQNSQAEITTLKLLYSQSQNTNISLEKRKEAYVELQRLYPSYFNNIKFEKDQAGKTKEAYDSLTTSIIATARARAAAEKITENASRQLANEQAIADAEAEYNRQGQVAKSSLANLKSSDSGSARFYAQQAASAEKEQAKQAKIIREAKRDTEILNERNLVLEKNITKQIQAGGKLSGSVGGEKPKDSARNINSIISQQQSLQKRIDEINKEYARKSLTKDEEELQAVRDKFKKIADEAAKFNANPKNRLRMVDTSLLESTRDNAIEDLTYKQTTERTKIDLEKQKSLYADYEDYKTKLGREAADDRFSKELNTYLTYFDILKSKQKEIADIAPEKRTGGQKDYLSWLETQIKAEVNVEQKKNDALVKEFISYADERKALTEKYEADVARLEASGSDTTQRTKVYNEKLKALDDSKVQELDAYKALFKGIENLSDENARKVISNADSMLKELVGKGKISKELADQIAKLIKDTNISLKDRMPDRLINLANQIDGLTDSVSNVDAEFGKVLSTLGNVIGQVGNIKKGMADLKIANSQKDGIGGLAAGIGIVGAGLSIFNSIFDRSQKQEEQAAYSRELQMKQTEALSKSLERQIALINDAYGTERLEKYNQALKDIAVTEAKYRADLSGKVLLTGDKGADDAIARYNSGTADWMTKKAIDDLLKKGGLKTISGSLGIEELNKLIDSGKLDEATGKIVQGLIDIQKQAVDTKNALDAETIGSSLDTIADDFVKNLTDGTQDFGKSFEDIIRTSILNGFKGKLIEQQLQAFYTQFAQATADGNLSEDEISKLRAAYLAASEKAKADFEALGKATGVDLVDRTDSKESALSKSIKGISSDQANALEGISRGQYEQLKLIAMLQGTNNTIAQQHLEISMQGLRWAEITAQNTGNTVLRLDTAIGELKVISKNTSTGSFRGAGLG